MATKTEKIIIELDFDAGDLTKQAAALNGEIKKLNDEQKALKKSGAEGSIQFQRNSEALKANKKELADTNKAIQNVNIANKSATGSMQQQKAQLSLLTAEYNKLSKEERENSARGQELNAQINKTTSSLKGNEEAIGDNRRSVGDYGKALDGTPFGGFISGLKSMGAALIANPIGLVITGIVAALALLKKAFTASEEGENKMAKATAVLSTIFDRLLDLLGPLADLIADSIGAAFDYLAEKVELAAKGLETILEFLNFDSAAESLRLYTEETKAAIQGTQDVADARAKADIDERKLLVERASLEGRIAELKLKSRQEEEFTAEERKAALLESQKLEDELLKKEQTVAKVRFEAKKLENTFAKSNKENLDEEAKLEADLLNITTRRLDAQRSTQRELNRVNKEVAANRKAAYNAYKKQVADRINLNKQELDLFIAQQGTRAKTLQEELVIAEQVSEKKLAILEKERKAKIINEVQYQKQLLEINQELLEKQTALTIDNAQRELDAIVKLNESKIEEGKFLNDELFAQEQQRLTNQLEAQIAFEAQRLEQGLISEQEYQDAVLGIKEEGLEKEKELVAEKKEADKEQEKIDLENQREIDILNREDEFQLRQEELNRKKEQEIAAAEATGADISLIEDKYAKYSEQLERTKRKAQIDEAIGAFQAIGGLAAGNAQAEKALAISSSLINAYQGITAVLAAKSTIPEPVGSILKGVQAAAIGATALINVNKIRSTPIPKTSKAERGAGFFGGKAHSQGGTKGYFEDGTQIEVEKDEAFFVVNKRNSGLINNLDALNQYGGNGDSFFARGGTKTFLQDGGIGLGSISSTVQEEETAVSSVVNAVSALPPPVVVVQDINQAQGTVAQVEDVANL